MKIYYDSDLISELSNQYLFLDTNALINAFSHQQEFGELLKSLKDRKCALITIPSVVFEFTRSDNLEIYKKRAEYLSTLVDVYPIEKNLNEIEDGLFVLQKLGGRMSYTDFLLCACLYKFREAYLITENHKDLPLSILDRRFIITIDNGKEIRNTAIYKLSKEKLDKAVLNIL